MEEQCSPLSWACYYQEEGLEELKNYVFYSSLELEAAILPAHDELSRKDEEILQLKDLIAKIIKERDEYQEKCDKLVLEKQLLFQQAQQIQAHSSKQQQHTEHNCPATSGTITSNTEDENTDLTSDENQNIAAPSPGKASPPPVALETHDKRITCTKPFPEKGKFLKAVIEAGPLLQTLLVAGPLPQWQHPPPQLSSIDIPTVTISSYKQAKVNMEGSEFSPK